MNPFTRDSIRIFHIEDDLNDVKMTDLHLRQAGFSQHIHHFNSCGKALDNLSRIECAPDVIILDINMPGMSGLEMLDWLRKKYREHEIPIIVLTGSNSAEDRQRAAKAGATKYLLKTGSFEELIAELDQLIATINQKQQEQDQKRQETLDALISKSKDTDEMVMLLDTAGRIHWVNESFKRVSGYSLDELRGKKPGRMLQGPQSDPEAIQKFHDAFHTVTPCECRIINYKKDGTPYLVLTSLRPVVTDDRLDGFLAIERVLSEEEEPIASGI